MLLRAIKVMVHETGHMFGLRHCRTYRCVQNGSNHMAESDSQPVFLCPNCLKKLQWNLKFDPAERYKKMLKFWEENGFKNETEWLRKRLNMGKP
jgi:archaemetzincin